MTEFRPTRFEILPTVIKNLLIINVLVFLAQNTFGKGVINLDNILALHHVKSPLFQPWQIITHMFMHGGLMHIFGNMFALWMFGSVLENLWGPKRFITFYFLCGIGAAFLHLGFLWYDYHELLNNFMIVKQNPSAVNIQAFFNYTGLARDPEANAILMNYLSGSGVSTQNIVNQLSDVTNKIISFPTMGASGAVFGILAAFIYLFPNTYLYLYFLFPVKVKWAGLVYFGFEIFMALQNSAGDNVARWAHIGGGIVGFLLVITWNKANRKQFY